MFNLRTGSSFIGYKTHLNNTKMLLLSGHMVQPYGNPQV